MIRAGVDANVLISHLLNPTGDTPPNRIVKSAIAQEFQLHLVETTLNEMAEAVKNKPYLATRIDRTSAARLELSLRLTAVIIPESIDEIPSLVRDPGDDYLLAHAVIEQYDYLVTGDQDLLVLGEFEGVRIVSPAEFVMLLPHLD